MEDKVGGGDGHQTIVAVEMQYNGDSGYIDTGRWIPRQRRHEFQNQFCACSAHPGGKCESGSLFNTKMPVELRVRDLVR